MKWDKSLNRYFNPQDEDENFEPESVPNETITNTRSNTPAKPDAMTTSNENRIGEGTKFKGDITATGNFIIDGEFEGTIRSSGNVIIGKSGVVNGNLTSVEVTIAGKIKGTLLVSELLSLKASARVDGEVSTTKLAVEPGAIFNASCDMNAKENREIKTLDGRERTEKPA